MQNITFKLALKSITHPIAIGAVEIVLLNDLLLRSITSVWFTSKVGDFAWLIFAPFLLAAILARLLPKRDELVGRVSIIAVAVIFALAKTVPVFHTLSIQVLDTLTGWSHVLPIDPTDLLALSALSITWRIWHQSVARSIRLPGRGWILLPLAVLATFDISSVHLHDAWKIGVMFYQIGLGIALSGLMVAAGQVRKRTLLDVVLVVVTFLTWIVWMYTLSDLRLDWASMRMHIGPHENLVVETGPILVILGVLIGLWQANKIYQQSGRALRTVFVIAVSGTLLYLLPYVLWTQGVIPFYATAAQWAIVPALGAVLAVNRFVQGQVELKRADTYCTHGLEYYAADDYDAALTEFDQALQLNPNLAETYFYRGLAHYAKDNYKLAMTDLDIALSYKPNNAEIEYWRGCIYADLGDQPKAIFALENALRGDLEPELRTEAEVLIDRLRH